MSVIAMGIHSEYWRITIQGQVAWRALEDTLSKAMRDVFMDCSDSRLGGMIEAVDLQEGETVLILSGNQGTADIFLQAFRTAMPNASIGMSKIL
ncbi:MAG: hypothetical protein NTV14_09330 [Coprothermobacterota bacterium]|nr:hypothetical protein [Coprothermobacterota bacterium]